MRPRPLIVSGVEVRVAELPEGVDATGLLRPARVYVRAELAASPRLPAVVAGTINALYRASLPA